MAKLIEPGITKEEWDWWDMDEFGFHVFALKFGSREKGQDCKISLAAVRYGRSHHETSDNFYEGQANARFIAASPRVARAAAKVVVAEYEGLTEAIIELRAALISAGYSENADGK